jgi:hypothetical protein
MYVKNELRVLMEKYQRTREKIRWEALRTGIATYHYDANTSETVNYAFDANQILATLATWATYSSDIVKDIDIMKRWFKKKFGKVKITAYHGDNVSRYLQNNTVIQHGAGATIRDQINKTNEITDFLGIKWKEYLTEYVDADGTTVAPYIPDDYIIFIANVPGSFDELSGPAESKTLSAIVDGFSVSDEGNGMVSYMELIKDPPALKVLVEEYFISRILRTQAVVVLKTT